MREIKFRAWLKEEKKMINVKAIDWDEDGDVFSVNYPEGKSYSGYDKDEIELMQYTGLKDKNGVEIFEGDIVNTYIIKKGIVCWNEKHCCFEIRKDNSYIQLGLISTKFLEVIGNIYENKELLEEKNA